MRKGQTLQPQSTNQQANDEQRINEKVNVARGRRRKQKLVILIYHQAWERRKQQNRELTNYSMK